MHTVSVHLRLPFNENGVVLPHSSSLGLHTGFLRQATHDGEVTLEAGLGLFGDRGHATATTATGVALLLLSWLPLWWGQQSVWVFIAGMLLIDLALQAVHICNQGVIYALAPQARSRINAVYMTGYFVGASTGSAVGAMAWLHGGWTGACLAGLGFGLCNLAALLHDRTLARSAP